MPQSQGTFPYDTTDLDGLEASLGFDRLRPYRKAAGRDRVLALRLYAWNGRLADALRFPLELLEVALSKRILPQLQDRYGMNWPWCPDFTKHAHPETMHKMSRLLQKRGLNARAHEITGDLTFGFWVGLLDNRFKEVLWRGRIDAAFPNLPQTLVGLDQRWAHVELRAATLLALRNRIAHHDSVWNHNPAQMQADIAELARVCCKATAKWINHHETVGGILRQKPKAGVAATMRTLASTVPRLLGTATVGEALVAMRKHASSHVLVDAPFFEGVPPAGAELPTGVRVITASDLAAWIARDAHEGIVELNGTLGPLLATVPLPVRVSPSALPEGAASAVLGARGNSRPRPCIAFAQEVSGAILTADIADLLDADAVGRPIIG